MRSKKEREKIKAFFTSHRSPLSERRGFRTSLAPHSNRDRNINLKEKKNSVKYGGFLTEANRFAVLIARAIAENHARYKNKLRHHWTGLTAN